MRDLKDLISGIRNGESSAHAYIIEGPAGAAREEFIRDIISGLDCHALDVASMQKSGKTGYRTEDAAAFSERLGMSAYGDCLIGVIDDADQMSEVVQNKLLKTLEEPSPDTIILLACAGSDALLSTVRSRCSTIRMHEYPGYDAEGSAEPSGELLEAAFMLLTQRSAFYEFREYLDKIIKTREDAIRLIEIAEDKLTGAMKEGKAMSFCADRIEAAEKAAADISRGMDKNKALKKLYLSYCGYQASSGCIDRR